MGHIYFKDDDEATAAPSQPVASTSGTPPFARCCARVRVDFDPSDPCYVFKATKSPDSTVVAASLSNGSIKLYSCSPSSLSHTGDICAHSNTISDIGFPLPECPYALYSCSRDGTIKGWDIRTRQLAESYNSGGQELFSFALLSDHMLAGGGQGDVLFWDRRTHRQLEKFDDMHMDDVTQVTYHATSQKLITASEDGLVAVHNVASGLNQDDGFEAALSVGTSVAELGLYGPQQEKMWCRTGTETLQLWEWLKATVEGVEGGDTAYLDLVDARHKAAQAASSGPAAPLFHEVDYLIGCHYDPASDQLLLLAGSNGGPAAFFPLMERAACYGQLPDGVNPVGTPMGTLHGCHESVVRSVQCFDGPASKHLFCLSSGEDARIGLWTLEQEGGSPAASLGSGAVHGGSQPGPDRQKPHQVKRHSPY